MTDNLADDDLDEVFDDADDSSFEGRAAMGGHDSSIRRKIEERLERKRLMEELDMLDDIDL
ncbi:hypothetical protein IMCC21906_01555 [Spongiibacter sp. IMCC21906]|uniref:PA3496 family putative envelope integrity protein n=1 Tax=Spongiibacter sp. IMCC21906 TaxID=1620392 RepID=UPI00062DE782|nr:hypothetical protein [Spongiibacter sp. IMCC21906]AKH69233.1 hypothetical protein IMCC21906_01555 [Spongiibacter sp. IMCC21906]